MLLFNGSYSPLIQFTHDVNQGNPAYPHGYSVHCHHRQRNAPFLQNFFYLRIRCNTVLGNLYIFHFNLVTVSMIQVIPDFSRDLLLRPAGSSTSAKTGVIGPGTEYADDNCFCHNSHPFSISFSQYPTRVLLIINYDRKP